MTQRKNAPVLPRAAYVLLGLLILGLGLWTLRAVFTPLFFAFFIAYMLDPLVDRFEARGLPRGAGIGILLAASLLTLSIAFLLVMPGIVHEFRDFMNALPARLEGWLARAEPTLRSMGIPIPHTLDEALASLQVDAREVASTAITPVSTVLRSIVGGTASVFSAVAAGLMVPVFAVYLLYDFDRMVAAAGDLVPYRHRDTVYRMARDVDDVLGHWVRGQFLVMVALGVLYAIAFTLAGVPLAIPIGIVAGLLSFIPYAGGALGLTLALLTCAVEGRIWPNMGYVVVAFGVVQLLEGFVITPKLVGDKVGLSAVVVLVALMVGNELFGFLGVLMAVPSAAVVKIFVMRGATAYRASELFGTPSDVPAPTSPMVAAVLREGGSATETYAETETETASQPGAEPQVEAGAAATPAPDATSEASSAPQP